jgi:hypothetical protein
MRTLLFSDIAYALRIMKARPGLTITIILTLAVGIGAVTAMFGTINAALFRSLPFDEPERLLMGRSTWEGQIGPNVGLVLGIAGSVAATRLLGELLFETEPTDPATFVGVALFLGVVSLVACLLPAWRASRVHPVDALRAE